MNFVIKLTVNPDHSWIQCRYGYYIHEWSAGWKM